MNTTQISRRITRRVAYHVKHNGCLSPEADSHWNADNRLLIEAMAAEHGEAWLGDLNGYQQPNWHPIWKWDGKPVCNFGASYVVPHYDAELERLIRQRADAPYSGVAADWERVSVIFTRISELGGYHLFWS